MILSAFTSEWTKLRRPTLLRSTTVGLAAAASLFVVLLFSQSRASGGGGVPSLGQLAQPNGLVVGLDRAAILLGVVAFGLASAQIANEYSLGTLRQLLIRQPRRGVLLTGKLLAVITFMIAVLFVSAIAGFAVALVAAHARHVPTSAWFSGTGITDLLRALGDLSLAVIGFSIFGIAVGQFVRSAVFSVIIGLAWLIPIEGVITRVVPSTAEWLPGGALVAIASGGAASTPYGTELVVGLGYVVLVLALAVLAVLPEGCDRMSHLILSWGYLALFFVTVLAAMGIPTGSELVIAFAGALASGKVSGGSQHLNLAAVIVVASAGELLGSSFGYGIGRVGGRALVDRLGRFVLVTRDDVDRAEQLFDRRGQSVVFFGRFVPLLRSFVGLAAGTAEMTVARFLAFTGVAAAIWCSLFAVLGFELGSQWSHDLRGVSDLGYGVAVFVVAVIGIAFIKRHNAAKRSQATTDAERGKPQHRSVGVGPLEERFRSCPVGLGETRQDKGARVNVIDEAVSPDKARIAPQVE